MLIIPAKHYRQIQSEERFALASIHFQKFIVREIARTLGRALSTINRELSRDSIGSHYTSKLALVCVAERHIKFRPVSKLHRESILFGIFHHLVCHLWSPEQISMTMSFIYPKVSGNPIFFQY
jgi:IS30 family transposase